MKEQQKKKNRVDELEKEINDLKERVTDIEMLLKGRRIEEKPSTMFM